MSVVAQSEKGEAGPLIMQSFFLSQYFGSKKGVGGFGESRGLLPTPGSAGAAFVGFLLRAAARLADAA